MARRAEAVEAFYREQGQMPEVTVPAASWRSPFLDFDTAVHPVAAAACAAVRQWVYDVSAGRPRGLVLWSTGFGCGKTTLARMAAQTLGVMRDHTGQAQQVTFMTAPDFFAHIRECYSTDTPVTQFLDRWGRGHFVLDDWGKQYVRTESSAWQVEQFFRLIERLNERRGFLMTSNLGPADIAAMIEGASWSRLLGMCGEAGFIDMSALPDYRLGRAGWAA